MLFADEITNPELFRNALKIILVGTGNVLSPHKYFQFERTLKNVVMNSESAFWIFFGKATFVDFVQKILGKLVEEGTPFEGAPTMLGRPQCGLLHGAPLAPLLLHYTLVKVFFHGYFGFFGSAHPTPWFSYK